MTDNFYIYWQRRGDLTEYRGTVALPAQHAQAVAEQLNSKIPTRVHWIADENGKPPPEQQRHTLEADGAIWVYEIETGKVVASYEGLAVHCTMDAVKAAITVASLHNGSGEAHHLAWIIDQMVRILAGPNYDQIVRQACAGADGPNTYEWYTGIAP